MAAAVQNDNLENYLQAAEEHPNNQQVQQQVAERLLEIVGQANDAAFKKKAFDAALDSSRLVLTPLIHLAITSHAPSINPLLVDVAVNILISRAKATVTQENLEKSSAKSKELSDRSIQRIFG